ncbi:MAG: hypothetical protein HOP23_02640 [Methylococcaceae bacterium]|nr:hypothetical protein [Methylococcaceae bacterium]
MSADVVKRILNNILNSATIPFIVGHTVYNPSVKPEYNQDMSDLAHHYQEAR